jgi:type VI secretion system protein ImpK
MPAPPALAEFIGTGNNGLLSAATPLLVLAQRLRSTVAVSDVGRLRRQVIEEMRAFEGRARAAGTSDEDLLAARYALCAALDESVLNTPWGAQSEWAAQTLLVVFHRESFGGEKFFQILERVVVDPARYINLMELMYACLSLGFEGRYRLDDRGAARLADVQRDLYQRIRMQRGPVASELSPRWKGLTDRRNRVVRFVPLWIVALGTAAVLVVTFVILYAGMGRRSEPVTSALAGIGIEPMYAQSVVSTGPRLKALLATQELNGQLQVEELAGRTVVTVSGSDMFGSGSAEINARILPVLNAVADALAKTTGSVTVIGHTDDQPVRSLRFPNNQELSRVRAKAVVDLLAKRLGGTGRLEAVGRGADQPRYTPANVPENRARNRRVEIVQSGGM